MEVITVTFGSSDNYGYGSRMYLLVDYTFDWMTIIQIYQIPKWSDV